MATSKEMTSGAIFPQLFTFLMPLLLGNLLQQTYSLIDAAIVGKFLGIHSLAAVGASTSVIFLILGFCNGCCAGFGIPVAQKFGARDYVVMRRYVNVGLQLAAMMSLVIAAISCFFCGDILRGMQTPDTIFEGAYAYPFVTFAGIPCTFFYNLLASIIRALGDSKTPFWFLLFSTILNILLDLFCIVVLGWGVKGAAIATVVAQGISAILCYLYMRRRFPILQAESAADLHFDKRLAKTLLAMGVPMGLQFSITAIGSIMLQSANNALGTACVAAFSAAVRIKMFFICPFESLGIAMATYCGQNYGAGQIDRILQGIKVSLAMMLTYAVVSATIVALGARPMSRLFVDASEVEVLDYAVYYLRVICCFYPVLGVLCILRYSIQGVGFSNFAMFSGVAEMIARASVSLWVVPAFAFSGVSFGDPMAWCCADLFLIPAFIHVYHKIKERIAHEKVSLSAV